MPNFVCVGGRLVLVTADFGLVSVSQWHQTVDINWLFHFIKFKLCNCMITLYRGPAHFSFFVSITMMDNVKNVLLNFLKFNFCQTHCTTINHKTVCVKDIYDAWNSFVVGFENESVVVFYIKYKCWQLHFFRWEMSYRRTIYYYYYAMQE